MLTYPILTSGSPPIFKYCMIEAGFTLMPMSEWVPVFMSMDMGEGIHIVLIPLQSNLCLFFNVCHIHDSRRKTGRTSFISSWTTSWLFDHSLEISLPRGTGLDWLFSAFSNARKRQVCIPAMLNPMPPIPRKQMIRHKTGTSPHKHKVMDLLEYPVKKIEKLGL